MRDRLAIVLVLASWLVLGWMIYQQRQVIQDQKIYISAGCHGRYQGTDYGQTQDDISVLDAKQKSTTVQCEDEREPSLTLSENHTTATIRCIGGDRRDTK